MKLLQYIKHIAFIMSTGKGNMHLIDWLFMFVLSNTYGS